MSIPVSICVSCEFLKESKKSGCKFPDKEQGMEDGNPAPDLYIESR